MTTSAWRSAIAGVAFLTATLVVETTLGIIIDSQNSGLEQDGFIPVEDMPPVGLRPADDFAVAFLTGPNYTAAISAVPIGPNYVITADHWELGDTAWLTDSVVFAGRNREQLFKVVELRHIPSIDVIVLELGPTEQYPAAGLNSWVSLYDGDESQGMTLAIGNYGWQQKRDVSDPVPALVPVSPLPRGRLAWGRNRIEAVSGHLSINQSYLQQPDHVDYEAILHSQPGDSGSGWYIKNGWEWQVAGLTFSPRMTHSRFSLPENRQLIIDAVEDLGGTLPATSPAAAPPTPTKLFSGSGDWNSPGNWNSSGAPDSRDIVRVWGNADIRSGSASAAELFVGKVGASSRFSLGPGGTLQVMDSIYLGPEAKTEAFFESQGGSNLSAESLYVGVYGAGDFSSIGGDMQINFVNVGTKNGSSGRMSLAANGTPINLTSRQIVVGRDAGSSGVLNIDPVEPATVNTHDLIVGRGGSGTLNLTGGGAVTVSGLVTVGSQGTVNGNGSIVGNVSSAGVVAPGPGAPGAGALTLTGDYTQSSSGKLQIQLGGNNVGSYDQLLAGGSVTLDGTLQVSLINGFTPALLDSFQILDFTSHSGAFAAMQLPALGGSLAWDASQLYTDGILKVAGGDGSTGRNGDFDDNGVVDAKDIDILWHIIRGAATDPGSNDSADLNGDTFVNEDDVDTMLAGKLTAGPNRRYGDADLSGGAPDITDYNLWRAGTGGWAGGDSNGSGGPPDSSDHNLWRTGPTQFPTAVGQHGGGAGFGASAQPSGAPPAGLVPEPATLVLMGLALPAFVCLARRQRRRSEASNNTRPVVR